MKLFLKNCVLLFPTFQPFWALGQILDNTDSCTPPQSISGAHKVCLFYPYSYTATVANPNIMFYWEAVQNNTIIATGSGPNFAVQWTQAGAKEVRAYRERTDLPGCRSNAFIYPVTDENITGTFSGLQQVCADATNNYSFSFTTAETYFWKLSNPAYGSIASGQGTPNVSVLWNHTTANISVNLVCIITKCGQTFAFNYPIGIAPQPSFTITPSPSSQCENLPVNFTVSSMPTANITSIAWDFGDGNTTGTTAPNTSHTYSIQAGTPQNFNVSATIIHTGCTAGTNVFTNTVTNSVLILPAPDVNLTPGGGATVCTTGGTAQQMGPFVLTISSSGGSIQWFEQIGSGSPTAIPGATNTTYSAMNITTAPFNNTTYHAVVTGSNGCVTRSNDFLISYVNCVPPSTCTPVAPAGWSPSPTSFVVTPLSCINGVASFDITQQPVIQGIMGGNLMETQWFVYHAPGLIGPLSASVSTTDKQQTSPTYQFSRPGDYFFTYSAYYQKQGGAPGEKCLVAQSGVLTVPLIANFTMQLTCNGSNNGYDLTLTDISATHPAHPVTDWEWYIDGVLQNPGQPWLNTLIIGAIVPGTYNIELIVRDGQGNDCSRSMTLVVPQLPVAVYTVTTTDPLSSPSALSSCEKRAVDFTSTSTGSIIHHNWQFGDLTSSWIAPVTTRVYSYDPNFNPYKIPTSLTVTDAFGCTSTATDTIEIIENTLGFGSNPNAIYTPQNQILCAGNLATVQLTSMAGGNPPFSYDWYESTQSLGAPSSATLSNISAAGAYWVAVEDAHGCQANANPTPATVNFINAPPVIIQGEQHRCDGEDVQLNAAAYAQPPATLSYNWVRNPGNIAVGTTKNITQTGLAPGIYTYTLTQTYTPQPGGPSCVTSSAPYQVEVHALPAPPALSLQLLDCNTYEIELSASHPFVPPYTLNWSTGQSGSPISVFHGGPYRAWITDLYGCKNHEDIDVPLAPNTFFWRFPQNACYNFCYGELPRQIDGPTHHIFDTWEWVHNNAPVTANGPYSGAGVNSVCDPLWLEDVPNGMGSGVYQWTLGNTLCIQTSDPMDISLHDCCRLDVEALLECIDPVNHIYSVNIFAAGHPNPGTYNLSVTDANGQPIGFFLPPNNTGFAAAGSMNAMAHMQLFQLSTPIIICVEITDQDGFKCTGCATVFPPPCDDGSHFRKAQQDAGSMMLIPNPANTSVEIRYDFSALSVSAEASRYLRITDAVGRAAVNIAVGEDKGFVRQDVSALAPGMYMVQAIWNGKMVETQKLIIQH